MDAKNGNRRRRYRYRHRHRRRQQRSREESGDDSSSPRGDGVGHHRVEDDSVVTRQHTLSAGSGCGGMSLTARTPLRSREADFLRFAEGRYTEQQQRQQRQAATMATTTTATATLAERPPPKWPSDHRQSGRATTAKEAERPLPKRRPPPPTRLVPAAPEQQPLASTLLVEERRSIDCIGCDPTTNVLAFLGVSPRDVANAAAVCKSFRRLLLNAPLTLKVSNTRLVVQGGWCGHILEWICSRCPGVVAVSLYACNCGRDFVTALANSDRLPKLQSLSVAKCFACSGPILEDNDGISRLQSVAVCDVRVSLDSPQRYGGIRQLVLTNSQLSSSAVQRLFSALASGAFASLECLYLGGVSVDRHQLADEGAAVVASPPPPPKADPLGALRVFETTFVSEELLEAACPAWLWSRLQASAVSLIDTPLDVLQQRVFCGQGREAPPPLDEAVLRRGLAAAFGAVGRFGTALHVAARTGNHARTRWILSTGAVCDTKDRRGCTPLFRAAEIGFAAIVELLVHHDADPVACNHRLECPLYIAALTGHSSSVWHILRSPRLSCPRKRSPLRSKRKRLSASNVTVPLPPRTTDCDGFSPLHAACISGNLSTAKTLLETGVGDVLARNKYKQTPLHLAARRSSLKIVQLLLHCGSETNARDDVGSTALDVANKRGNTNVCKLLQACGGQSGLRGVSTQHRRHHRGRRNRNARGRRGAGGDFLK